MPSRRKGGCELNFLSVEAGSAIKILFLPLRWGAPLFLFYFGDFISIPILMIRSSTTGKKKRKNNRYSFASLLIWLLYSWNKEHKVQGPFKALWVGHIGIRIAFLFPFSRMGWFLPSGKESLLRKLPPKISFPGTQSSFWFINLNIKWNGLLVQRNWGFPGGWFKKW